MSNVVAPLVIGPFAVWPPVVLAPMAGVTNAPFRELCRAYGPAPRHGALPGLYVNEMVMAVALLHGNAKTERMIRFAPDEQPRSLQLYGSDPAAIGGAIARLVGDGRVDHVDLNFGCPARKVTRRGGGAAVPLKRGLLRNIVRAAVRAAGPSVPVTIKFRKGIHDELLTYLDTGRIAADEGAAAIALHARTAEQHYAGRADWDAIGELKAAVSGIPVLGNGDIWEAHDALAMMAATGCDGVVVGRGCLGRPWLFGDLGHAFAGKPVAPPPPRLGEVVTAMRRHVALLDEWADPGRGVVEFRKHAGWYLTGYPVGGEVRRRLATAATRDELDAVLDALDPVVEALPGAGRMTRGHTNGPIRVALPDGYLDRLDDDTPPDGDSVAAALSGG